jgi:hypothetical protein
VDVPCTRVRVHAIAPTIEGNRSNLARQDRDSAIGDSSPGGTTSRRLSAARSALLAGRPAVGFLCGLLTRGGVAFV